jgi:hypothetical protein
MDWENIVSVLMALLVAVGIPLALRARRKGGPQNMERFFNHLQEIGVKASRLEKGAEEEKVGAGRAFVRRSEGVIAVEGRNVDFINVTSVASQYGVNYFLDYLVRSPSWTGRRKRQKTSMIRKRSSGIYGKVADIEWRGDDYLSRELDYDYRLKDMLLQAEPKELKGGISIIPEPKYEYARIRTPYLLPSSALFEAINIIAGHIKSGW